MKSKTINAFGHPDGDCRCSSSGSARRGRGKGSTRQERGGRSSAGRTTAVDRLGGMPSSFLFRPSARSCLGLTSTARCTPRCAFVPLS